MDQGLGTSFDRLHYQDDRLAAPPHFHPFSRLPLELRLKILSDAHPPPSTIHLDINVMIADPSFGLYLTFILPSSSKQNMVTLFPTATQLQLSRSASLLSVTHESRSHYLSHHPIPLPSGKGKIHLSHADLLHIFNFEILNHNAELQQCLARGEELHTQEWVKQITQLAIPLSNFSQNWIYSHLWLFPKLNILGGAVWATHASVESYFNRLVKMARGKMKEKGREVSVVLMNLGPGRSTCPVDAPVRGTVELIVNGLFRYNWQRDAEEVSENDSEEIETR